MEMSGQLHAPAALPPAWQRKYMTTENFSHKILFNPKYYEETGYKIYCHFSVIVFTLQSLIVDWYTYFCFFVVVLKGEFICRYCM